jgi:two-component system, OmpR family, sensor histidine kinase KdpD
MPSTSALDRRGRTTGPGLNSRGYHHPEAAVALAAAASPTGGNRLGVDVTRLALSWPVTARGTVRTYLGTAPGVGKTYAMLAEGWRRRQAGERVVVGWVETHGRTGTRAQLGDLEVVGTRTVSHRGSTFADLDVDAVIGSGADVALVDELAHAVPDSGRGRWQDVTDLLDAGIDVLTSTNVANIRSVRDFAARITGAAAVELVPDEFLRSSEVVLVDLAPEALRRRIAAGSVYPADQARFALADYFRAPNIEALSELGHAWVAGTVEAVGTDLLVRHGLIEGPARPLVVAGVSGSRRSEQVVRAAAHLAEDGGADLVVVHARVDDGLSVRRRQELGRDRALAEELGGTFIEIEGSSPAQVLADVARAHFSSRVVVAPSRSRLVNAARWSVGSRLRRLVPGKVVDEVYKTTTSPAATGLEDLATG